MSYANDIIWTHQDFTIESCLIPNPYKLYGLTLLVYFKMNLQILSTSTDQDTTLQPACIPSVQAFLNPWSRAP